MALTDEKILIRYFLLKNKKQSEFAQRRKRLVPRIGDEIRFNNVCYTVDKIIWVEDEPDVCDRVHLLISEVNDVK